MNPFIETIVSSDPAIRHRSFWDLCAGGGCDTLLRACHELEQFRQESSNLYDRVRACLFLYAAYRFVLQEHADIRTSGTIPHNGLIDMRERRFEDAIRRFRGAVGEQGPSGAVLSALAEAYHQQAFQTLSDQVRRSVRASVGNRWMFRGGHAEDHPIRLRPELCHRDPDEPLYPILMEATPVRLDLSHSGWSDIFFLGMDYPEGARVLNVSVDLGVYGRDTGSKPPIQSFVRAISEPVLRLTSLDLETTKDIDSLGDLFNFGNDYLSLLKAGVIASGIIPPSFEGTGQTVASILSRIVGPGMGLEVTSSVNDIPKGSRLAVSTNLLASLIGVLMRATGQTAHLEGPLTEPERRLVASRAILGEWLGGSGGGWQDSGGIWPGIKVIEGARAEEGDPEHGISRGCLLPRHRLLGQDELHPEMAARLHESLVVFHGGMAQNVGPILEMVTEKYLLRKAPEWPARQAMRGIFDGILTSLRDGDVKRLAECTTENWNGPLKTIIPWVSNRYTEEIIDRARRHLGKDFWGFLMLGGMSGGGMAMFCAPERHAEFRDALLDILRTTKHTLDDALPFAMEPVVYNFGINSQGTVARLMRRDEALMPSRYYGLHLPILVRRQPEHTPALRRLELQHVARQTRGEAETRHFLETMVSHLFRVHDQGLGLQRVAWDEESRQIKEHHGFDAIQHEQIRGDLRNGRIGLSRNRLPADTDIEDVLSQDIVDVDRYANAPDGGRAIREGRVAVLTLAGGVGTRWTSGAGVIKAINPFVAVHGRHRSFLEIHLAKTRHTAMAFDAIVPHVITTSYLSHGPIEKHLERSRNYGFQGPLYLSRGSSIGHRLVPMVRDLVFLWEETPQETLDEQKQKVRDAVRGALMDWAREKGEGSDYTDNVPMQRFHPPGHWYEVPNLLLNGTLARLLREHPQVETLMLHNIDTLGANVDAAACAAHLDSGNTLSFEVIARRISDRGGGLARVNGKTRLLEGLAQPRDEDELRLRYYNSMTTWVQIDPLLASFGLSRTDLNGPREGIVEAVRRMARRMPTYVTIKDVKRRWGHGQEDVFPVAQFEKLWSDMTSLNDVSCGFLVVPRPRGQQLKDPSELDAWANDGSKDYVESLSYFV